jgi:hypothetical protein
MSILMRVAMATRPEHEAVVDQWLKAFDAEAFDGGGDAEFTDDPKEALRFKDLADAMATWKTQSRRRPLRADGRPNRPLTEFSVTFDTVDDESTP